MLSRIGLLTVVLVVVLMGRACADEKEAGKPKTSHTEYIETEVTDDDKDHWSFRPLNLDPKLPKLEDASGCRTPLDLYVAESLSKRGLRFSPSATRRQLIRRLSFDLTGMPPSRSDVQNFLADERPGAYERLVERLLASSAYGEHQAQSWLDLARFAETDGYEHDKVRPDAWQYRDWVIRALNRDMPYDKFVQAQVAGDLIATAAGEDNELATSFCLSGPDMPDINSQEERRHLLLNELTSTVGEVFLGLQVGCAQCHDHKYDPISQADFYRLRAFFNSAVHVTKNKSVGSLRHKEEGVPIPRLMIRGAWDRPGREVAADFPRVLAMKADVSSAGKSTRDRRDLAVWLTSSRNPIVARVIANRIWQQHFGRGLAEMTSDFGLIGNEPSHPALLDWLAAELIRQDWSIKSLRRIVVSSTTYRQSSLMASKTEDAENYWYSRYPRRRLTGEQIRDAMIAVSGRLNTQQYGRGVLPPLPAELTKTLLRNQWKVTPDKAQHVRRSIYVFARRNLRYPIFDVFDRPDANASCAARSKSTTAPQSLLLFNSEFSLETARHLAGRLMVEKGEKRIETAVELAWGRKPSVAEVELLTKFVDRQAGDLEADGRDVRTMALPLPPTEGEPFRQAALVDLCLALINANEFIYYD